MIKTTPIVVLMASLWFQPNCSNALASSGDDEASVNDSNLRVETVVEDGLLHPTSLAFLAPNDLLVLEKEKGTVKRIINGQILDEPLLRVNVANNSNERGMLGIAVAKNVSTAKTHVFLYYTEAAENNKVEEEAPGNRLYRYELVDNKLINPKLLLDIPAEVPFHNGGSLTIGPDENLYLAIGCVCADKYPARYSILNDENGTEKPDGRGGIIRMMQDGEGVEDDDKLSDDDFLDKYYAYGIRNSFGLGFDPVTGKLWDTENGPDYGDEINLVIPGFNSGWKLIHGMSSNNHNFNSNKLVDFSGKGQYSDPEFVWTDPVSPTALTFLSSNKLGKEYQNDLFVGDSNNGRIYHFDLNRNRTELVLEGSLADKMVESSDSSELEDIIFARGFDGAISDIEGSPDGYLYVVSIWSGKIYRIVPESG